MSQPNRAPHSVNDRADGLASYFQVWQQLHFAVASARNKLSNGGDLPAVVHHCVQTCVKLVAPLWQFGDDLS